MSSVSGASGADAGGLVAWLDRRFDWLQTKYRGVLKVTLNARFAISLFMGFVLVALYFLYRLGFDVNRIERVFIVALVFLALSNGLLKIGNRLRVKFPISI